MSIVTVFDKIKNNIILQLKQADNQIKICVAWFTDEEILKVLLEQAKKDIFIEIIILNDEYNRAKSFYFNQLIELNSKVYFVDNNNANGILHHKFCLIDNFKLITGSYNWTNNATRNNENIVIVSFDAESPTDEYNMIQKYHREFDKILVQYGIIKEIDEDAEWDLLIEESKTQDKIFSNAFEYYELALLYATENKIDDALEFINEAISICPNKSFYSIRHIIYRKKNNVIECCGDLFIYMKEIYSNDFEEIDKFKILYKKFIIFIKEVLDNYKYISEINNKTRTNLESFANLEIEPHFFTFEELEPPF
jgi:tetratricopeptide (TPR) repeat protein